RNRSEDTTLTTETQRHGDTRRKTKLVQPLRTLRTQRNIAGILLRKQEFLIVPGPAMLRALKKRDSSSLFCVAISKMIRCASAILLCSQPDRITASLAS